ncbi:MAG: hypothetical protein WAZ18_07045 [Alphaproteobacteria bacterium]
MDIRIASYASNVSANPSPLRATGAGAAQGTQAARAVFQSLLAPATQQTAAPATEAARPAQLASNPDGRGSIIDILV